MSTAWTRTRLAVRVLARTPGLTMTALVTLALGIGAAATLFSLADGLYLRRLDVPDAAAVVHVYQTRKGQGALPLSLTDYTYYRRRARSFEQLAAHYSTAPLHVVAGDTPISATGSVVTANYFTLLRIAPQRGRFFLPGEDEVPGRDAVAVVSDRFWRDHLGSDAGAIGRTLRINGHPFTVIGVAPRGFQGVVNGGASSDLWIPSAMFRIGYRYCNAFERGCTVVTMLGRLAASVRIADAQAELDLLARQLEQEYPDTNEGLGVSVGAARGGQPDQRGRQANVVALLLGCVAILLLIACANVAGLLLTNGLKRRREIAIRLALGAARGQIVRQLLAEAGLMALGGGLLGLLLAAWAKELVVSFYVVDYAGRPLAFSLEVSAWVFVATAVVCGLATLGTGLFPALQATRVDILSSLTASPHARGPSGSIPRDAVVILQIALATVLLVSAGLLVRSLGDLYSRAAVDVSRIVLVRLRPSLVGYDAARARQYHRRVIDRLEAIPGVEAASASDMLPLFFGGNPVTLEVAAAASAGPVALGRVSNSHVGDGFFEVLGITLLAGREFTTGDTVSSPPVAIVNEALASRLGGTPIGRRILVEGRVHEIVGVAPNVAYAPAAAGDLPYLYLAYWQQDGTGFAADSRTHIRVSAGAGAVMPRIRRAIAAVDPDVPITEDYPLADRVRFTFQPVRVMTTVMVSFGAVALLLSTVGLYGLVALTASARTREIAIRLALGAQPHTVRHLILAHGLRRVAIGLALGVAAAALATRALGSVLYGVAPDDPATFAIATAALGGVAMLASWLPARRALRADPALVLRQE